MESQSLSFQPARKMIERKIRYDSTVVDTDCELLKWEGQHMVLFHEIVEPFTMQGSSYELTIPKGSYTVAHYWADRPYNVYVWRDYRGTYLGAYFNLVQQTNLMEHMVSFEDMIIDVLSFPDGSYCILDEDELPVSLPLFEEGSVLRHLNALLECMDSLLHGLVSDTQKTWSHEEIFPFLSN
ncbi:DUF402 domain-containing protein [Bacillus sp. 1P06AnD]|uniref:DUF402 domain-containing protein n=1 Tax=Bacillus sp. 1P06AnD TaxID=3132208 RepID=UPI00399FA22C